MTAGSLMEESHTSSLHLDNLFSQPPHEIDCSDATHDGQERSILVTNPQAVLESKQREHQRLFKEYLKCCKGTYFDSSMEPHNSHLGFMDSDDFVGGANPTKELSSFLPPNRSSGCAPSCRKASTSAAAAQSASGLFVAGGRDAPASASTARAATHKRASISNPAATYCDSQAVTVTSIAISSAALQAIPALPSAMESSVYRAQVATALKAGRAVWL
mmetsp:Transcript_50753/g.106056  ORF Transcript_50753/g.106056 Transcript_50753/m.106056 type:complete len:217 (-) Transcript_50753:35-685(-)